MMAASPPFFRDDSFQLDGLVSPGVCRFSGAALKRKWDSRAGYGTSGATSVYAGDELSDFQVTLTFHDWDGSMGHEGHRREDWLDFARQAFVKPPSAKGSKQPKAQLIEYWEINDPPVSITSVDVLEVGQPDTSDETGLVTVTIKFRQHRSPTAGLGKPTGTNVPGKKNVPTAKDAQDLQIDALVKQLKEEVAKP